MLSTFFGVLYHYNGHRPIRSDIKDDFETFFAYYWKNNKNQAITTDKDMDLLDQLPNDVKDRI